MSPISRPRSIFVKTDPDLHHKCRDAIQCYINTVHDDAHVNFSNFPRIIWHCQNILCPVCDGEGFEIVKCQRVNHIGDLNSKYEYKAPCSVCHGEGVAPFDSKNGIDHKKLARHRAFMASRGRKILLDTILGEVSA